MEPSTSITPWYGFLVADTQIGKRNICHKEVAEMSVVVVVT